MKHDHSNHDIPDPEMSLMPEMPAEPANTESHSHNSARKKQKVSRAMEASNEPPQTHVVEQSEMSPTESADPDCVLLHVVPAVNPTPSMHTTSTAATIAHTTLPLQQRACSVLVSM